MIIKVDYKDGGKSETFTAVSVEDHKDSVTIWLVDAVIRPSEKYPICDVFIRKEALKRMIILF